MKLTKLFTPMRLAMLGLLGLIAACAEQPGTGSAAKAPVAATAALTVEAPAVSKWHNLGTFSIGLPGMMTVTDKGDGANGSGSWQHANARDIRAGVFALSSTAMRSGETRDSYELRQVRKVVGPWAGDYNCEADGTISKVINVTGADGTSRLMQFYLVDCGTFKSTMAAVRFDAGAALGTMIIMSADGGALDETYAGQLALAAQKT